MKRLILTLGFIIGCLTYGEAQSSINDYKYVIVENQFHFQNEPNEYDLNNMVRFQFRKYGFVTIIEGEDLPPDLKANYCLALKSKLTVKGMLRTKATIVLINCENEIVYQSIEGVTKEKDLVRAYNISIRKVFDSFNVINYKYKPNEDVLAKGKTKDDAEQEKKAENEIKKLKAEIQELKEQKEEIPIATKSEDKTVEKREVPFPDTIKKVEEPKSYLNAKPISNGFVLIDNKSNKVEYTIYKTGMDNVFTIKDKDGVIYKKGKQWKREYMDGEKTIIQSLDIRF